MSAIRGTIRNGKVEFDEPIDLPDGTEVRVEPAGEYVGVGMREEDWPTDEAGIAALLARIDQMQPWMTPEELAEWDKVRAEQKAWQLANWDAHCKKIEDLFK